MLVGPTISSYEIWLNCFTLFLDQLSSSHIFEQIRQQVAVKPTLVVYIPEALLTIFRELAFLNLSRVEAGLMTGSAVEVARLHDCGTVLCVDATYSPRSNYSYGRTSDLLPVRAPIYFTTVQLIFTWRRVKLSYVCGLYSGCGRKFNFPYGSTRISRQLFCFIKSITENEINLSVQ